MKNLQIEMASFLSHNNQTNYFHYLHKGNGIDPNRNEYILDMLLYSILKSYVLDDIRSNQVFLIIDEILKLNLSCEDMSMLLKTKLFMVDLETYNKAIENMDEKTNDDCFLEIVENSKIISEKVKNIVYHLIDEMETLSDIKERKRVAC